MYSFLPKEKEKEREIQSNLQSKRHSNDLTPLSPSILRWQSTLQVIRNDRCLLHMFLHRLHTRGDIFLRLFHVRFEDTLRRLLREELPGLLPCFNLPPRPPPDQTIPARYWLVFLNQVENPTFTTDLVRDKNGDPIKVAIYDTYAQSIISPGCSLSSAKVRLIVLNAEPWKEKGENWSRSEFNQTVLRARERMGSILIGPSLTIRLENGLGTFENISFNDNSSWTKSGFQLGVMVEGEGKEGYMNGERVREGVSEPFRVKDRHVKDSQKPYLLELNHDVRCLKKVGKDRASLLQNNNIKTVENFLWCYYNNEPELRKILGIRSETNKEWKSMVEHAMQCANEFHAKYNSLNNSRQPQQALAHPIGRNMSLYTNEGRHVVGSGSSEPNPHENDIIEGPAIDGQISAFCGNFSMNASNEHISTASVEHIVETQQTPFHETNHTAIVRGNIVNVNPMQSTTGDGFAQFEIPDEQVPMEDLLANAGNSLQGPSMSDSFNPSLCEVLVQDFIESLSNNSEYVEPPTPRKKRKMNEFVRLVTFVTVIRKRPRIVPPANQMPVPAI